MGQASILDEILEPLANCLSDESARRLAALRVASSVQQKIDLLARRANDGSLTEEECGEYESVIEAADIVAKLKRMVRRRLEGTANTG